MGHLCRASLNRHRSREGECARDFVEVSLFSSRLSDRSRVDALLASDRAANAAETDSRTRPLADSRAVACGCRDPARAHVLERTDRDEDEEDHRCIVCVERCI